MRRCLVLAALLAAACGDPLHAAQVAALGPEDPRVPPGPMHRPGQPCLVCHGDGGSATPLAAAGTLFRDPAATLPIAGADVILTDAARKSIALRTNCAGNFFVYPRSFAPVMPLWASAALGEHTIQMESPMHRDGDCAQCHADGAGPASAGHLFLTDDPLVSATLRPSVCP